MKLRRYAVTPEVMAWALKVSDPGQWHRVTGGPPRSAEFLYCYSEPGGRVWWLVFTDESFNDHREGWVIETGDVVSRTG